MPKIKKPAWGLLTAANWWGKIKYSDRSIVQLRDGSFYAMKAGTTKVTVKYKNKKSVFKVKVKSDGVKVSMKTSFDMNAVSKDWVREQSVIDECDSFDATLNKFDGLVYDYDIEDWVYTKDKSKTKEIIEKLKYEDGKKRFYNTTLKPLTTATKAKVAELSKKHKTKYKTGKTFNTITLTVKNNTSHKVSLPTNIGLTSGAFGISDDNKPYQVGEYFNTSIFKCVSGKKTTIKPGCTAKIKYVCDFAVFQPAEAYKGQSDWGSTDYYEPNSYIDVQSSYSFRISTTFLNRIVKE